MIKYQDSNWLKQIEEEGKRKILLLISIYRSCFISLTMKW